jgi:hypothetical protein
MFNVRSVLGQMLRKAVVPAGNEVETAGLEDSQWAL